METVGTHGHSGWRAAGMFEGVDFRDESIATRHIWTRTDQVCLSRGVADAWAAAGAGLKGAGLLQSCRQLFGGTIQVRVNAHGLCLIDVGFDIIGVEAGLWGTSGPGECCVKDAGIRFHGTDFEGRHTFIHQVQNGKTLFDKPQMCDAGVGEQDKFFSGGLKLVQNGQDTVIQPEDIGYCMAQGIDVDGVAAEIGEFLLKLCFGDFSAFHSPLPSFVHQKGFDLFRGQAAEFCDVTDHTIMGEMNQNVAHIKKTGLDSHGDLRCWGGG